MRRFDCGKTFVRFVRMLNWRPGKKGMVAGSRTCPSSSTSPVRISFAALSTSSGFIRFPEPRSSPAPHFEGQRWLSAGGIQDCPVATRATSRSGTNVVIMDRIILPPLERQLLPHDQVQNPVLHVDLLPDLPSVQKTRDGRILCCSFKDGFLWSFCPHFDGATKFAVDLDRNCSRVKRCVGFIPNRQSLKKDRWRTARTLPEFIGEMRGERRVRNRNGFSGLLV